MQFVFFKDVSLDQGLMSTSLIYNAKINAHMHASRCEISYMGYAMYKAQQRRIFYMLPKSTAT